MKLELLQEVVKGILQKEAVEIRFPNLNRRIEELVELECYRALKKIKAIIEDNDLADDECFMKIEKIICVFEKLGSNGGNRYDFG